MHKFILDKKMTSTLFHYYSCKKWICIIATKYNFMVLNIKHS